MKYQKILALVVGSVILSGCSLFPASKQVTQSTKDQVKQAEKLSQVLQKGGQAICTITQSDTKETYTITVKGKKMKMSGVQMGEGAKKGYMINDTIYTYIWDESSKQGFKTKLPTEEESKTAQKDAKNLDSEYSTDNVAETYDDETKYVVNCKEGGVNDSEFIPPADVKFVDPSAMIPADYLKNIPTVPAE